MHALATSTRAGFLSPAGYQFLAELSTQYPRLFSGAWLPVQENGVYLINHDLGAVPEVVQVWFRESAAAQQRRRVDSFFNPQQRFCGFTIADSTDKTVTVITGDRVWAGYTTAGFQEFSSGEYSVQVLCHG